MKGVFMANKRTDYISWDEYFMGVAKLSGLRSKDPVSYTHLKYITVDTNFTCAESKEEEEARLAAEEAQRQAEEAEKAAKEAEAARIAQQAQVTQEQAANGQAVIDYACQFIGNPYVWGGTSLTNGADCSGFIQSVYRNFGISLPRTSYEMRSAGYEVSYENAMPGDIMCYEGHVGLYMGCLLYTSRCV